MVVHHGQAVRGEADPVAEQRRAARRAFEVTRLERSQHARGDGLRGPGDGQPVAGQPVLGQQRVQAALSQVRRVEAAGQGQRQVGRLQDQGPAGRQPEPAQPQHLAGAAQPGTDLPVRGDGLRGQQPGGDPGALGGQVGGEAAQVAEVVLVPGRHVGPAAVPGGDQPVVGQQLERLAQRHDADPELGGQVPLGGQGSAGRPLAAGDPVPQLGVDPQVLRLPVLGGPPRSPHGTLRSAGAPFTAHARSAGMPFTGRRRSRSAGR